MTARAFFEGLETRVDPSSLASIDQSYPFETEGEGTWHAAVHPGGVRSKVQVDGDLGAVMKLQKLF